MCALETSTSGHAHHKPTTSAMSEKAAAASESAGVGEVGVVVKS